MPIVRKRIFFYFFEIFILSFLFIVYHVRKSCLCKKRKIEEDFVKNELFFFDFQFFKRNKKEDLT